MYPTFYQDKVNFLNTFEVAGNVYYYNLRGLMEELEILFYTAFESLISIDSSKWCLKCVFLKNENLFRDVSIDRLVYLFK